MLVPASSPASVWLRSYGAQSTTHCHDFAQLVLPLEGSLEMEIGGRGARLDRDLAAYIDEGTRHDQASPHPNRVLIVDLDRRSLGGSLADRLAARPLIALPPEARSLVDYMGLTLARGPATSARLSHWMPLLIETLGGAEDPQPTRLTRLLAALEKKPFEGWTAAAMAAEAGLSTSRLHAVFRAELSATPRAYLAGLRLAHVQRWLAEGEAPIAELAYRGGYADQSALTRAMRRATGLTPAAFRRRAQEKPQETPQESGPSRQEP
ncbi:AraC family transcriptional regulator [Pseudoroseomonas deserti]|uniref:AraC family transcriptional regulator n=1 Tax=Teichococcus deserti TaxID=1817963 RepID=A0A1V2H0K2_9PROT|nr:AraC family transcriptional regulator [Pseudoroseomonas deserti]ONG50038.1 AraC family transcriptional regulator [Pseudoroseomonas deserti]